MTQRTRSEQEGLQDAFHRFNEISINLTDSYRELEKRVAALTSELAAARSERIAQLAEKERLANRLGRLLTALPAGVVVLDGDNRVQECNRAAAAILGEPLLDRDWSEIETAAFSAFDPQSNEVQLHNGKHVAISRRSLGDEPGTILLLHDVTERYRLQDSLNRSKRLSTMGQMAASLAHQIRTPLAAAILYLSHISQPGLTSNEGHGYVKKIQNSLRNLEKLANDILVFARGGGIGNDIIQIADLLQETQEALESQVLANHCQLEVIDATKKEKVRGNREALLSAIENLGVNAIQASAWGGKLTLEARVDETDGLSIFFSDYGCGIPEELQAKIFEPFFTTRSSGTGLGLAVVQAVARAHNGDISVISQPGGGSTFCLRLPLVPIAAEANSNLPGQSESTEAVAVSM